MRIRDSGSDVCSSDLTGEAPRLPRGLGASKARRLEDATAIFDGALAILAALPAEFGREVVVRHRQAPESRESSARAADFRHSHSTCLAPASGYLPKKRCADRDLRSVERRCLRSEEHPSELQSLMRK